MSAAVAAQPTPAAVQSEVTLGGGRGPGVSHPAAVGVVNCWWAECGCSLLGVCEAAVHTECTPTHHTTGVAPTPQN